MNIKLIVAGAVGGFLSAAVTDVWAWANADGDFNWGLAVKRWVAGALSGALAASGYGQVAG